MLARHLVIDHQQQPLIAIKYGNWQSTNILNANFICEIGCINKLTARQASQDNMAGESIHDGYDRYTEYHMAIQNELNEQ
ncbi:Hapless [Dirofilaria immitis]